MSKSLRRDLGHVLVLPLPLLRVLHAETLAEHLSDSLQWHSFAFGIAEHHENPAEEAYTTVETKGAARRHAFHHGQEC